MRRKVRVAKRLDIEPFGFLIGSLDEEAVLACADEKVSRHFDCAPLEEHFEPAFLAPAYAVEDRKEVSDHSGFVLDRAHGGVLDVVAEDVASARVNGSGGTEEPRQNVGAMNRVFEQRTAARLCSVRSPRTVTRYDIARRPVLVVAQRVAHRRAEFAALGDPDELVDERMKARVESNLRG